MSIIENRIIENHNQRKYCLHMHREEKDSKKKKKFDYGIFLFSSILVIIRAEVIKHLHISYKIHKKNQSKHKMTRGIKM